jgi:hypothetical protein
MNQRIIKLALKSGMLNYVDNETPRHYFLSANADEECLNEFAELIVRECILISQTSPNVTSAALNMKQHFGVEEFGEN